MYPLSIPFREAFQVPKSDKHSPSAYGHNSGHLEMQILRTQKYWPAHPSSISADYCSLKVILMPLYTVVSAQNVSNKQINVWPPLKHVLLMAGQIQRSPTSWSVQVRAITDSLLTVNESFYVYMYLEIEDLSL
jgi:hypothetical protein